VEKEGEIQLTPPTPNFNRKNHREFQISITFFGFIFIFSSSFKIIYTNLGYMKVKEQGKSKSWVVAGWRSWSAGGRLLQLLRLLFPNVLIVSWCARLASAAFSNDLNFANFRILIRAKF
jgi:hypothetical protein